MMLSLVKNFFRLYFFCQIHSEVKKIIINFVVS